MDQGEQCRDGLVSCAREFLVHICHQMCAEDGCTLHVLGAHTEDVAHACGHRGQVYPISCIQGASTLGADKIEAHSEEVWRILGVPISHMWGVLGACTQGEDRAGTEGVPGACVEGWEDVGHVDDQHDLGARKQGAHKKGAGTLDADKERTGG